MRYHLLPSQITWHPSYCANAKDVPWAKLAGVIVATPAPLLVKILDSPTTVPFARETAKADPLLQIIYDEDVEAAIMRKMVC